MTLIVSLRTPDGIVIAGDSLSTLVIQDSSENITTDIVCPECNHNHQIEQKIQGPAIPLTTFPYAQKILPFYHEFGIGTFGSNMVGKKSIYFTLRMIEQNFKREKKEFNGVTEVGQQIASEVYNLYTQQSGQPPPQTPNDNESVLGLHLVGYDDDIPKTIEIFIQTSASQNNEHIGVGGCTYSGIGNVIQGIWGLYENIPESPPFTLFSLQDAIDYSEFLIQTTINHQRFSHIIPNVGGAIDIALITPFDGFRWIRQKPLIKTLETPT